MIAEARVSPNFPQKAHFIFIAVQFALKRRDIFPFHSPGRVTYHTAHTATPLSKK